MARRDLLDKLTEKARQAAERPKEIAFPLEEVLFGPQLAFVKDSATFATASCSRRAGKSVGIGAWLLEGPILNPAAPSVYITKTRGAAKRIIWPTLLRMNREHNLGYEANESDLVLKRDGIGMIYLVGVNNDAEIDKLRGTGWGRAAIDEAQSLPVYVRELVDDVLMPSLMDHDGQIRVIGTPAPVKAGFFYDLLKSDAWTPHSWTVWDNPHIPTRRAEKLLADAMRARGVAKDHPSIQREFFGRWENDPEGLVFQFDSEKNVFDELPDMPTPWNYVFGVDIGFDDSDAISVLAFNKGTPNLYQVEEWVGPRQLISELAARLDAMVKRYHPIAMVVDQGGLGKKIAEEIRARPPHVPLKPAEKSRKFEYIELVNDSLRTGHLKVRAKSKFAADAMLVEWDRDKSTSDRRVIKPDPHSDILDAALYAFRECLHWTHIEQKISPKSGTPAWFKHEADGMFAAAQRRQRPKKPWGLD